MKDRFPANAPFIPLAAFISNQTGWLMLCLSGVADDNIAITLFDQSQHAPHSARFMDLVVSGQNDILDAAFELVDVTNSISIAPPPRSEWLVADFSTSLNEARKIPSRYQAVFQGFEVDADLRLVETRFYRESAQRITREIRPYRKGADAGLILTPDTFSVASSLATPHQDVASIYHSDCHCCPQKLFDAPLGKLFANSDRPARSLTSPRIGGYGILAF